MDGAYDVPDSTDWLNTPLKDFSTLENALHCEICKEFYETPMITSCCHTFCSKCIRTALSTDGRCPSCRTADQASKLRNNFALQEVVARFLAARPTALEVARKEQEQTEQQQRRSSKRKRTVLDCDDIAQAEQDGRTTRSKSRRLAVSQSSQQESIEIIDSDDDGDGDFEPEQPPDDGLVECPLGCGKRMKIEAVEPHLDKCEDEKKQASRAKSRAPVNSLKTSRPPSAQASRPQERLSELNYSLLTETKLKQKLGQLGIPNSGPKQLLIKRHTEWVNLWNANCDSQTPRSERELLRDLEAWERTQGGKAPHANGLGSTVMRKDFDGAAWVNRNKDDFSRLIAEAQRRKLNPSMEQERPKAVDIEKKDLTTEMHKDDDPSSPLPPGTSQSMPPPEHDTEPIRPYENNPEAISSIREKVEAANAGQAAEPLMNAGFKTAADDSNVTNGDVASAPLAGVENAALLEQIRFGRSTSDSQDEQVADGRTGSPFDLKSHLHSSPRKLPMFAVPQQPFSDFDGGGAGGQ